MDALISFGLGLLTFITAFCLAGLARAMRNDKLPPNMWAGIRTKAALESESSWYQVQRAGSVPVICLATAYADSGLYPSRNLPRDYFYTYSDNCV